MAAAAAAGTRWHGSPTARRLRHGRDRRRGRPARKRLRAPPPDVNRVVVPLNLGKARVAARSNTRASTHKESPTSSLWVKEMKIKGHPSTKVTRVPNNTPGIIKYLFISYYSWSHSIYHRSFSLIYSIFPLASTE